MTPQSSTRIAWSIAVAALALWLTSAPSAFGQISVNAERFLQAAPSDQTSVTQSDAETTISVTDSDSSAAACPTATPAQASNPPAAAASGTQQATFHLCGASPDTAHAIEQLIAGRSFSSSLSSHGDGCADLTIRVTSDTATNGTVSSNLSVSLGGGTNLSIQIESAGGSTHVSIRQSS